MPGPAFLHGDRIELRTIEPEDAEYLQGVLNDPRVWRSLGMGSPVNRTAEEAWIESLADADDEVHLLACVDGDPVGVVGLNGIDGVHGLAEVGYYVEPAHQGQGYATEAVELLVGYGFDQRRLHRVWATVYASNDASMRVLEKVGFTGEGVHREAAFLDGEYVDVHRYGLLAHEWRDRE